MTARTWSIDDLADTSPGDYLIGIIEGRWESDVQSQRLATAALLFGVLTKMGRMGDDEAWDQVQSMLDRQVTVTWDGNQLRFAFGDPEDDVPEEPDEDDEFFEFVAI